MKATIEKTHCPRLRCKTLFVVSRSKTVAENSKIEWTDHTFNPWMGCTKVSPACKNCYAERDMDHRYGKVQWGPNGTRVVTGEDNWRKPIRWNREANEKGVRYRVFCASLADVFEDWKGHIHDSKGEIVWHEAAGETLDMNAIRDRLFDLINDTPYLDWLLLTKRPENIWDMWPKFYDANGDVVRHKMNNVWLGTTVENQEQADKRIPALIDCRELSPVLFLSCEPLLGPVNLNYVAGKIGIGLHTYDVLNGKNFHWDDGCWTPCDKIDWVIAGGESGNEARPMHHDWARSLRDQCQAAKVQFHFKQWGEWLPMCQGGTNGALHEWSDGEKTVNIGKKYAGRLLDGRTHDGFPLVAVGV